jgi:NADH-quinone oxidoreductase subunit K
MIIGNIIIANIILGLGIVGIVLSRKNIIIMIMCIEMLLLGINYNSIIFSIYLNDITGQILAFFVLSIAAGESAIGLAILVSYYRIKGTVGIKFIKSLKG